MAFFTAFLKRDTKNSRNGRDREGDQGEVPVEPEHQAEHAHDGQQVDENVEGGGRGEALDGLDVGGDGAEQSAGLMGVVVAEREPLQMMVGLQAQIVGHPLPYALGVVVVDIGGNRAQQGDDDGSQRGQPGDLQFAAALQHGPDHLIEPVRKFVSADHVVDDDLERPGRRQAHGGLHHHGEQDDQQSAAIGSDQVADQAKHTVALGSKIQQQQLGTESKRYPSVVHQSLVYEFNEALESSLMA